jgi:hypothetical protein
MNQFITLSTEQYRILLKRITGAIEKAKYTPAAVGGWDGPELAAKEVLRPFMHKDNQ